MGIVGHALLSVIYSRTLCGMHSLIGLLHKAELDGLWVDRFFALCLTRKLISSSCGAVVAYTCGKWRLRCIFRRHIWLQRHQPIQRFWWWVLIFRRLLFWMWMSSAPSALQLNVSKIFYPLSSAPSHSLLFKAIRELFPYIESFDRTH